ncbi:MAG: helix-turn-helix domain-containing protein [Anaerolineales bacterium]|nr:helix-turn-helix domain-containing protein [Anaerolineales bacterium]
MKNGRTLFSSSVERALMLLEAVRSQPHGVTLAELLAQLDISRSTLFVLLHTLKALGYLEQAEKRGRYRAGPRLLAWRGSPFPLSSSEMLSAFFQEAEMLGLGETVALFVPLEEQEVLMLGQVESRREVRSVFKTGQRLPAESAPGQVFYSEVDETTQLQGYCVALRGDALDLAFPICPDGIFPTAALVLSLPAFRGDERTIQEMLPRLRAMAARLSYRFGATTYSPWRSEMTEVQEVLPLDEAQIQAVLKAPWAARLACVRPDGTPHVVPVWYEWDGKAFHVLAWKGSRWGEYLCLNPQVSLTVDEPFLPLRRVVVKGIARPEFDANDPRLSRLLERLRRRYLGLHRRSLPTIQLARSFSILPSSLKGWQGWV